MLGLDPAVVQRVEAGELRIGDLEPAHPERPIYPHSSKPAGIGGSVGVAHDEFAGGDSHKLEARAIGDLHLAGCPAQFGLAATGLVRCHGPAGACWTLCRDGRRCRREDRFGLRRRDPHGFFVHLHTRVTKHQLPPALGLVVRAFLAHCLGPRAVIRGIEVDPRHQPIPRLLVKLHSVMALGQHLHKFRGVGLELHGTEHVDIALDSRPAHIAGQLRIGHGEMPAVGAAVTRVLRAPSLQRDASQVRHGVRVESLARLGTVTAGAVAVQHRLDLAGKREPPHRAAPRRYVGRLAPQGQGVVQRRGISAALVATHARDDLAGHAHEPAPHDLHRLAAFVQRLNRDRRVGRHAEQGRAILLDRHGAQHALDVPRPVGPDDAQQASHAVVAEVVSKQPQLFDLAFGDIPQPAALVDVGQVYQRVLAGRVDLGGDHRRAGRGLERDRFEHRHARLDRDEREVVERVDQVEPPR